MRFYFVSVFGLLSVAVANAGQIQLGGTAGLTYNYITQGSGAVCAAGTGNCVIGSTGGNATGPGTGTTGFVERNYDIRLFQNAANGGTSPTTPVPYTGYNQGSQWTTGGQLGKFAMIQDGTNTVGTTTSSSNFWDSMTASEMVVPVGVSNVVDVATMLSNLWGPEGASDTTVTFNFGTTSNASIFNDIVEVSLQNSGTATSAASGQIGSGVDCATAVPCGTSNPANGSASGPLSPSTNLSVLLSTNDGATFNPANLIVTTLNLANGIFGGTTNGYTTVAAGTYAGTAGNLSLDSQDFKLASLVAPGAGEYLVSIDIAEGSGASAVSQTALSAITITTTPEPSTVILFLTGLGALCIAGIRRKNSLS